MTPQSQNRASIVIASLALLVAVVGWGLPALADSAGKAGNADTVDGKHAVGAKASVQQRRGKLVATSPQSGRLPNNIIAKAPNAAKLGGKGPGGYLAKNSTTRRTLSFPAQSLNTNPIGANPVTTTLGLRYAEGLAGGANLSMARPPDWAGTNVTASLMVTTTTGVSPGQIGFFIRPTSWDSNEEVDGVVGINSTLASVGSVEKNNILRVTLPADQLAKEAWELTVQRRTGLSYGGNVTLMSVALEYDSVR